MTRVERLIVHRVSMPLVRPFVTAVRATAQLETVLVQLIDSDGRSGWGEAPASWRVTGESPVSIEAAVSGPIAEAVIGRDAADLAEVGSAIAASVIRNSSARSAVDCAGHDLAAQLAGLPLHVFLGGRATDITTDMTISATSDHDQLVADALGHAAAGFRTLKIKVGAGGDDDAAVRAVRVAVGPDVRLRVDANQGWTAEQAITIVRGWEDAGTDIEFVEQPVAARRLDDLALVTSSVDTPILADEAVWDTADLREIIRRRAADAVNLKLAKSGGLTEARAMAALAAASSMRVIVGCMMESTVGIGAAGSLVSSLGPQVTGEAQDLDAGLWLSASAVDGGAVYRGDRITLSAAPGAGIESLHARTRSAAPDLSSARLEAAAQSATEER